jgi:hypothetical protein
VNVWELEISEIEMALKQANRISRLIHEQMQD